MDKDLGTVEEQPQENGGGDWQTRAFGFVLLLQALILIGLFFSFELRIPTNFQPPAQITLAAYNTLPRAAQFKWLYTLYAGPVFVMLVLASVFYFLSWRTAWPLAMVAQNVLLLVTLITHFRGQTSANFSTIYPLMLTGVVMVLLLNTAASRRIIQRGRALLPLVE
jgi:hypothetical protein